MEMSRASDRFCVMKPALPRMCADPRSVALVLTAAPNTARTYVSEHSCGAECGCGLAYHHTNDRPITDLPPKAVPPRVLVQAPPFGWGVVQEAEVG